GFSYHHTSYHHTSYHHTGPEEVSIPAATGGRPISVEFKYIHSLGCNIKALHQIRPELLCVASFAAGLCAFVSPPVDALSPNADISVSLRWIRARSNTSDTSSYPSSVSEHIAGSTLSIQ